MQSDWLPAVVTVAQSAKRLAESILTHHVFHNSNSKTVPFSAAILNCPIYIYIIIRVTNMKPYNNLKLKTI